MQFIVLLQSLYACTIFYVNVIEGGGKLKWKEGVLKLAKLYFRISSLFISNP